MNTRAVLLSAPFLLAGCLFQEERGSVEIHNLFVSDVIVSFRARETRVSAGATAALDDIPVGEYRFATVVEVPVIQDDSGRDVRLEEGESDSLGGVLSFPREGTMHNLVYTGSIDMEDTSFVVKLARTSNLSGE